MLGKNSEKKADRGDAMAWVHTDSPALISWGAISAGQALRRAALRFYAQARVDRHTAHKAHARRLTNPVPPLANEGEFPQLPRPALRRRTRRQPPGTRPPTNPSAKRATEPAWAQARPMPSGAQRVVNLKKKTGRNKLMEAGRVISLSPQEGAQH